MSRVAAPAHVSGGEFGSRVVCSLLLCALDLDALLERTPGAGICRETSKLVIIG